ncbi:MAG: hypothetical protein F6K42_34390 [Leptolyngbya sp. SIO1D8]|nr:hypothetical protein [Leptolyngbya sp. SIO1D8]
MATGFGLIITLEYLSDRLTLDDGLMLNSTPFLEQVGSMPENSAFLFE